MKYLKKFLLALIAVPFVIFLLAVLPQKAPDLFFIPMLAIAFFAGFYMYKQSIKDDEEIIKKGLKYVAEDVEAEKWVKNSFAPDTLTYIKANRWIVIMYSFLFVIIVLFFWGYLTNGLLVAIRNLAYGGILFWTFIMYVLIMPGIFKQGERILPKKYRNILKNDWISGYFFLLPITFLIYLLFPYETLQTELLYKLASLPIFWAVYSSFFLCMYCIITLSKSIQEEEQKELEKKVKKMIE